MLLLQYFLEGLTSQREVHRDGAHGIVFCIVVRFGHRNPILSHQVDVILSCWCIPSEGQRAFLLLKTTRNKYANMINFVKQEKK